MEYFSRQYPWKHPVNAGMLTILFDSVDALTSYSSAAKVHIEEVSLARIIWGIREGKLFFSRTRSVQKLCVNFPGLTASS